MTRTGWARVGRILTATAFLWAGPAVMRASLIANGGFETADFTGWTVSGVASVVCADSTYPAHSGSCGADFGTGGVSQNITTAAGGTYTLDFWLSLDGPGNPYLTFSASWDGATIFSLTGNQSSFPYTHEVFTNLTASTNSTSVSFSGAGQGAHQYVFDDVNVLANSNVNAAPEPGTIGMLLAGLAALGGARSGKRRQDGRAANRWPR